jgi:hypothetical protein
VSEAIAEADIVGTIAGTSVVSIAAAVISHTVGDSFCL